MKPGSSRCATWFGESSEVPASRGVGGARGARCEAGGGVLGAGAAAAQAALGVGLDEAHAFVEGESAVRRALEALREVGLGHLRLGQPATELSGGEAQRTKLATELQRVQKGDTLYVLDEPTTGLHPADVDKLMAQLQGLVDAGNSVVLVEHDMSVIAASDWVVDMGPGAGDEGGRVVAAGPPREVAQARGSRTAPFLREALGVRGAGAPGRRLRATR